jgi:hypothetical protein
LSSSGESILRNYNYYLLNSKDGSSSFPVRFVFGSSLFPVLLRFRLVFVFGSSFFRIVIVSGTSFFPDRHRFQIAIVSGFLSFPDALHFIDEHPLLP